ncbi:hypothetical protein T440DRAFT_149155 [Plenodomus tracheiphilus IPT5]|uniref:Uncharacterized protein n=1 Tax=Plenodomus tracheiphilus IPT5 TaxID=1408161 RepID=A0A6A7B039_9PLEO|nr:hypothetical protein T440DRAFT_149155 [Plenodomus tracheiphilus IPT5]
MTLASARAAAPRNRDRPPAHSRPMLPHQLQRGLRPSREHRQTTGIPTTALAPRPRSCLAALVVPLATAGLACGCSGRPAGAHRRCSP